MPFRRSEDLSADSAAGVAGAGALLRVQMARKRFGGVVALDAVSFDVQEGDILGVIGPNGAGKSTLLRVLAGTHRLDSGEIWLQDQRIDRLKTHQVARAGIGLANQIPRPFTRLTVRENVAVGAHSRSGARTTGAFIDRVLERTGLSAQAQRPAGSLALVDRKRLEMARALSLDPRLLLLDEVAAGLADAALDEVMELVESINRSGVTVILVEHIEALVHRLARRVLVLDWGKLLVQGTPAEIAADEQVQSIYLGTSHGRYEQRVARARTAPESAGHELLRVESLGANYGQLRAIDGVSLRVSRGELVAVVGANGAGKSTLAKAIAGGIAVHDGTVSLVGTDVTTLPAYERAKRGIAHCFEGRRLFGELSVAENLAMGAYSRRASGGETRRLERVHELFPVLRDRAPQQAGTLSGGQQQMLAIGRALMADPVLLVLDEVSLGLSPKAADEVYAALGQISAGGVSILLIEQSVYRALEIADRVYVMDRGRITYDGPVGELLSSGRLEEAYFGRAGAAVRDAAGATAGGAGR
jgi:branched-chain amino acid transport system ATP-binding protein